MKHITYYKKLLKLIESLKNEEIYPKYFTSEGLTHELANLYVGWYLLGLSIEQEDKNLLIDGILPTIVTHIIQSIFYDTISHYQEEMLKFYNIYDEFKNLDYIAFDEKLGDIEIVAGNAVKNNELSAKDYQTILQIIHTIDEIKEKNTNKEEISLIESMADNIYTIIDSEKLNMGNVYNYSINKWIEDLKKIPKDIWKKFAYHYKKYGITDVEKYEQIIDYIKNNYKLDEILDKDSTISKDLNYVINEFIYATNELLHSEVALFLYMDKPYYEGFYKYFLPLYNEFKAYLLHPTKDGFEKLMMQIDHIKDIQHHSDFFWTSLQRPTMDFISHAKIKELIQYVNDSDIKKIYKKYYPMFNKESKK